MAYPASGRWNSDFPPVWSEAAHIDLVLALHHP